MPRATPTGAGGDALIQALQGKLAAPFTGTLADALTDSDAQLAVTVASGHVLPVSYTHLTLPTIA